MAQPTRQFGLTPPISTALPTPREISANDDLIEELKSQNNFETPQQTEHRKTTLALMQRVAVEFVRTVSKKKGLSQAAIDAAGGKIFTFGSYRLGVYGPGSDIDTLVVAPKHVSLDDFFHEFPLILERMSPAGAIEKMTPVPDAFVPIIKIEYAGLSIDLIFGRLVTQTVPITTDLKNNELLRGLVEEEVRPLNGTRVTDEILESVPQQKTFRLALRAVKLWAQRRAIYSNVMGFLGGVAWAMLVARVCQLYPAATGSVIVGKFFRIIGQWAWPQPVMLKTVENGPLQLKIWNPKIYTGDRYHIMPIITPAYPSMCATHNVSQSTQAVIMKELKRGGDIVDQIFTGQRKWEDLFAHNTFFTQDYKYYLSIVSSSTNKEAQSIWSGFVESRVRFLVKAMDRQEVIEYAHPFPKGFEREHKCKDETEVEAARAGSLAYRAEGTKTETTDETNDPKHNAAVQNGDENVEVEQTVENGSDGHAVYTTTYYIGLSMKPAAAVGGRSLDISRDIADFRNLCQSWLNYKEGVNEVKISHVRNFDLPDDVFQAGETKPVRPKKKVLKKVVKRPIEEVEGANANGTAKRQASVTNGA